MTALPTPGAARADRLATRLSAALGADAVVEPGDGWTLDGAVPSVAVMPRSPEEIAAALRVASEERAAVVVWGGGTRIGVGARPLRYDVALSLSRLARVVRHEPGDLTASVEAGTPLAVLQAQLAANGQELAVDTPFAARATVGGTLASGTLGPRSGDLGPLRNLVVGVVAVTADGRVTHSGGRVVKSVTGYDLPKLYARSFGTLAVLAELHLRLAPRPARETLVAARFGAATAAARAADALRLSPARPAAVSLVSPELASAALGSLVSESPPAAWWILACWRGAAKDVAAAVHAAERACEAAVETRLVEGPALDEVWDRVAALAAGSVAGAADAPGGTDRADGVRLVISLPPASVAGLLDPLRAAAEEIGVWNGAVWLADRGQVVHHLIPPAGSAAFDEGLGRLRAAAHAAGGHVIVERLPSAWKTPDRVWGPPPAHQPLVGRVKAAFDPEGLFAPGRLPGGL